MKKIIAVLLILSCITTVAAAFADGWSWTCPTCGEEIPGDYNFCPSDGTEKVMTGHSWPVRILSGSKTKLKSSDDESKRYQSFFGPNRNYHGAGAYKPYKVSSAKALFSEGGYVLVDLSYKTVGRRMVYFQASALTNSSVESVTLTGHAATTNRTVQPYYGPGTVYDAVDYTEGGMTRKIMLDAYTDVSVFFETNGWVFAEFYSEIGMIRAWLPVSAVR